MASVKQFEKLLASAEFKAAMKEANKAQPMAASKGVNSLCEKYAAIKPKAAAIALLVNLLFPKNKTDFMALLDGLTAFCDVQPK